MRRYFRNIWDAIITTCVGFSVTFRHLFTRSVTLQYPKERADLPERTRMQLYMNWDDCIGCEKCARACPVDCIHITTVKAPKGFNELGETSNGTVKRLFVEQFDIDMSECMYCSLCVYPCPTDCLYMIPEYESSVYDRDNLLYDFTSFSPDLKSNVYNALDLKNPHLSDTANARNMTGPGQMKISERDENAED